MRTGPRNLIFHIRTPCGVTFTNIPKYMNLTFDLLLKIEKFNIAILKISYAMGT